MIVGVVGLGLIGGSLAKAYKDKGHTVYAYDIDDNILSFAQVGEFIDGKLDEGTIPQCDVILMAIYPKACVDYYREHAEIIDKHTIVMDCCGVKGYVCRECFQIARDNGLIFIGGHPMAGKHQSGFAFSRAALFKGAYMVLVPEDYNDINLLGEARRLLEPLELGHITVSDADNHDKMIAFTSQMAHVISNAFIKSPTAKEHKGFSAGSYKDMTRVAWLNEEMWTELFLENKDNLLYELDTFIASLNEYRDAIMIEDSDTLRELLAEGKRCKEEVDG